MTEHKHKCTSTYHEGPRVRTHFDDHCYQPFVDDCIECSDLELAAMGATWEMADSPSDADPGL